jgi:hypothetical protein
MTEGRLRGPQSFSIATIAATVQPWISCEPDLLRPLDAGQLAQLLERVRHRFGVAQVELLDGLDPLTREQLHQGMKSLH